MFHSCVYNVHHFIQIQTACARSSYKIRMHNKQKQCTHTTNVAVIICRMDRSSPISVASGDDAARYRQLLSENGFSSTGFHDAHGGACSKTINNTARPRREASPPESLKVVRWSSVGRVVEFVSRRNTEWSWSRDG